MKLFDIVKVYIYILIVSKWKRYASMRIPLSCSLIPLEYINFDDIKEEHAMLQ